MSEMSLLVARNVAFICKCFVISACGIVTPEMADGLLPSRPIAPRCVIPRAAADR